MEKPLPSLRLTGGRHLRAGGWADTPLAISDGRIVADAGTDFDVSGHLILPGMVDLRSAAWRTHMTASRPDPGDVPDAMAQAGNALLRCGVTTAWISAGWMRVDAFATGTMAEAVIAALPGVTRRTGLSAQPRIEADTHLTDTTDRIAALIARGDIAHLGLMPLAGLLKDMPTPDKGGLAAWAGARSATSRALLQAMDDANAVQASVPRHLCRLAEACDSVKIGYSSLYDRDAEAREFYRMIGARMADAPRSRAAASSARAMGDPVLIEARDAIGPTRQQAWAGDGLVDAMVSGDVPSSLLRAVLALEARGLMPLETGWSLVSETPAAIMGRRDRGRLAEGNRADLVFLDADTRHVAATVVKGHLVWGQGEIADRLAGAADTALAAE